MNVDIRLKPELLVRAHVKVHFQANGQVQVKFKVKATVQVKVIS